MGYIHPDSENKGTRLVAIEEADINFLVAAHHSSTQTMHAVDHLQGPLVRYYRRDFVLRLGQQPSMCRVFAINSGRISA